MGELPEPLTPADCDLRDFPRMMIDITRIFSSGFNTVASRSPIAWMIGHKLWYRSWHQVPAGSLPDDDDELCHLAELGFDIKSFKKARDVAMRGWVKCSDGRLYHPTVCEIALESWIEKLMQRLSSGAGNAKRWGASFDPAAIDADIDDAVRKLQALAPNSKAIPKARRRQSQRDPAGSPGRVPPAVPSGSKDDPTGIVKPSHRESRTPEKTSQGTGTGTGTVKKEEAPNPAVSKFAAERPEVRRVLDTGRFGSVPADKHLVYEWLALPNMELERDIIPMIDRISGEEFARRGRAPFTMKFFDGRIREQHAADEAEIARLRRGRERIAEQDERQRAEDAA